MLVHALTVSIKGERDFWCAMRVHAWASLISCGTPHLPIQPTANGTPCYRRNWLYHRVPSPSPRSKSGENMGTVGC
ncbi:hypothetical protein V8C43DRAFT_269683 [Trichoderma afarasin]